MDKAPGWERRYYNSYGNYIGYRFQDFSCGCPMQTEDGWAACNHPKHFGAGTNHRPCECRQCPCVEEDIDDDTIDYSEGEQPIRVIETPNVEGQGTGAASCARYPAPTGCASGGED